LQLLDLGIESTAFQPSQRYEQAGSSGLSRYFLIHDQILTAVVSLTAVTHFRKEIFSALGRAILHAVQVIDFRLPVGTFRY